MTKQKISPKWCKFCLRFMHAFISTTTYFLSSNCLFENKLSGDKTLRCLIAPYIYAIIHNWWCGWHQNFLSYNLSTIKIWPSFSEATINQSLKWNIRMSRPFPFHLNMYMLETDPESFTGKPRSTMFPALHVALLIACLSICHAGKIQVLDCNSK